MYDRELTIELLTQIHKATMKILHRFEPINPRMILSCPNPAWKKFDKRTAGKE